MCNVLLVHTRLVFDSHARPDWETRTVVSSAAIHGAVCYFAHRTMDYHG